MHDYNSADGLIHRNGKRYDPNDHFKEVVELDSDEAVQLKDDGL